MCGIAVAGAGKALPTESGFHTVALLTRQSHFRAKVSELLDGFGNQFKICFS